MTRSTGGFSNHFGTHLIILLNFSPLTLFPAQPAYQSEAVSAYLSFLGNTYDGLYNKTGRAYPDVAAIGVDVETVLEQEFITVNGTSCSSPIFASIIGLINNKLAEAGKSPLGFLNPL